MTYNAEQVAFMLHEAIDQNREYKSWHVSTQHLMTLVEGVVAEEREACVKAIEDQIGWNMDDPASTATKAIRARGQV